jgi:ABC-type nickel/cobalt efflux system permease component RcnA
MIASYIVGSMKTLRNALFMDLTDSIVGKMAVMTTIAIEERAGLKRYFGTFISFLI